MRAIFDARGVPLLLLAVVLVALPAHASDVRLSVEVNGVDGDLRQNVLSGLSIHQRHGDELPEGDIRRMHGRAESEIRATLEPFGHYRPNISSELIEEGDGWQARYSIEPGPAVRLTRVEVRVDGPAADDEVVRERVAAFALGEGDPLRHAAYEQGKNAIATAAAERGYLNASFASNRVTVDVGADTASIELVMESGERYSFGPVRFEQTDLTDDLLQGFVPFQTGDPYRSADLLALQNALGDSDLFRSVDVDAREGEADDLRVPIVVTLQPRPRFQYSAGIGYGTDTGTRGTFGGEVRRLNRHGHRLSGEVRASWFRQGIGARYAIPFGGGSEGTNQLAFTTGYEDNQFGESRRSRNLFLGTRLYQNRWGWREVLSLELQRETFQVGRDTGQSTLVLPGAEWSRTRADNPIYATRGHRLSFDIRGTDDAIGSDVSFLQGTVRGKVVRPVAGIGRLLARADLGSTTVDRFALLPGSLRFFAGGDRSVRGFGFEAIGPADADGIPIGGRHLLTGSLEYEHRIGEQFGAAIFYDAGNALNDLDGRLEQGAGIGARWISPVGLLRLDVASALTRPGISPRVHITIGPDL